MAKTKTKYIADNAVTNAKLNADVAGTGISGGAGSALALDINSLAGETSADDADTVAIYDDTAGAIRKMSRSNLLNGVTRDSAWDANTILAANSDNTPLALTIPEQRLVGRITAGNITALTPAQIKTLCGYMTDLVDDTTPQFGGDFQFNEKMGELNPSPVLDHTANGFYITDQVDENTFGLFAALHIDADGNWVEAHADSANTIPCKGLALETSTGSKKIFLWGFIRDDTWNWTPGAPVYVSDTTSAGLTQTEPADTGDQVQIVGYAKTADVLFFCPDNTWIEING